MDRALRLLLIPVPSAGWMPVVVRRWWSSTSGPRRPGVGSAKAALRHVRRHYVTRDNLRRAIARPASATFAVRDPELMG